MRRRIWKTVNASISSFLGPEQRAEVAAPRVKGKRLFQVNLGALARHAPNGPSQQLGKRV